MNKRALRPRPARPGHSSKPDGRIFFPEDRGAIPSSNRVIQGLWFGEPLSDLERLCMKSFMANGHEFHLYAYDELQDVPKGVVVKDANHIVSRETIKEFRWFAGFSDYFRYSLLLRGGWYVDMDVVCLRPLDFSSEYVFASSCCMDHVHDYTPLPLSDRYVYKENHFVGDAFLKAPANSALMIYCCKIIEEDTKKGEKDAEYDRLGPRLFKKAMMKFGLEKYVQVPIIFDPVVHTMVPDVLDQTASWDLKDSYVVHLSGSRWEHGSHAGSIGSCGLLPNATYSHGCLYEKLKKKYEVTVG